MLPKNAMERRSARRDKVEIYLHLLWTTWDRLPLIEPDFEKQLHEVILAAIQKEHCRVFAVNGVADHIHCLISIRSTTRVCDIIKTAKGTSAVFAWEHCQSFKWRPTYAAFSVSRWDVARIQKYIRGQKRHHAQNTTIDQFECFDEEYYFDDEAI